MALAACAFAEVQHDQETAEQFYAINGYYPSWYGTYPATVATGVPTLRTVAYPYTYGAYPYAYSAYGNTIYNSNTNDRMQSKQYNI